MEQSVPAAWFLFQCKGFQTWGYSQAISCTSSMLGSLFFGGGTKLTALCWLPADFSCPRLYTYHYIYNYLYICAYICEFWRWINVYTKNPSLVHIEFSTFNFAVHVWCLGNILILIYVYFEYIVKRRVFLLRMPSSWLYKLIPKWSKW